MEKIHKADHIAEVQYTEVEKEAYTESDHKIEADHKVAGHIVADHRVVHTVLEMGDDTAAEEELDHIAAVVAAEEELDHNQVEKEEPDRIQVDEEELDHNAAAVVAEEELDHNQVEKEEPDHNQVD